MCVQAKSSLESCSKCFKCGAEFDTGDEFFNHMKLDHSLEFTNGHWKGYSGGDPVEKAPITRDIPVFNTTEETNSPLSQSTIDSQAPATKDSVQDRTLKRRIEKQQPVSRLSVEIRREPTPPTRHISRIIATLAKVVNPSISSAKANKQHATSTDECIAQDGEAHRGVAETMGSDYRDNTGEKAQILRAPANFGGQFSVPPRTFENVAAGHGSFTVG